MANGYRSDYGQDDYAQRENSYSRRTVMRMDDKELMSSYEDYRNRRGVRVSDYAESARNEQLAERQASERRARRGKETERQASEALARRRAKRAQEQREEYEPQRSEGGSTRSRGGEGGRNRSSSRGGARGSSRAVQRDSRSSSRKDVRSSARGNTRTASRRSNDARSSRRSKELYASGAKPAFPQLFGIDLRIILVVIVLLVAVIFGLRSCAGCSKQSEAQEPSTVTTTVVQETSEDTQSTEPAEDNSVSQEEYEAGLSTVRNLVDSEYADALAEAADTDDQVKWIVAHVDDYAVDGSIVQAKLMRLAAIEPTARTFVRNWPEKYPASEAGTCDAVASGEVPLLQQWDERWGYTLYCNTTFALTGCCPTSLCMVYQGLTGNNDLSPYDLGVAAANGGYMDDYNGTSTAFLTDYAPQLGLSCSQISVDSSSLTSSLQSGHVVICNVGPGDFTTGGHFIVLTGIDDSGNVQVNDPFSYDKSQRTWSVDTLIGQTKALFAYSLV